MTIDQETASLNELLQSLKSSDMSSENYGELLNQMVLFHSFYSSYFFFLSFMIVSV